jgi:two-component system chemotaxis response regulator CheY
MKTLIVEDDFTCRFLLQQLLGNYGPTFIAVNGKEAVEAFRATLDSSEPYDLICMDIMMPIMDGLQASKTIREIERGKGVEGTTLETAIVITSAVEDPATIIRACYECGANYYFVKPLDFNQMKRQMQKLRLIT